MRKSDSSEPRSGKSIYTGVSAADRWPGARRSEDFGRGTRTRLHQLDNMALDKRTERSTAERQPGRTQRKRASRTVAIATREPPIEVGTRVAIESRGVVRTREERKVTNLNTAETRR